MLLYCARYKRTHAHAHAHVLLRDTLEHAVITSPQSTAAGTTVQTQHRIPGTKNTLILAHPHSILQLKS